LLPGRRNRKTPMTETPLFELRNVNKSFGTIHASRNVSLHIGKREIVGLLGDNGAGKSTLIKIISGVYAPDSGEIWLRGKKVDRWTVATARRSGLETVFQDRALARQQTIVDNMFMGREITNKLGFIDEKKQVAAAGDMMRGIGFTSALLSPLSQVQFLSGGEQQGIAIARALYFNAELILLDEPTTALSLHETYKVFGFARQARDKGSAILFISHNIYHAWDLCDRFIILDRGTVTSQIAKSELRDAEDLIKIMEVVAKTGKADARVVNEAKQP
jgi:simple sugar transport system ATP-binding protein